MHEFELGVWKSIYTHLMRILYAAGGNKIQTFNKQSTICHFSSNVSDQGKLAARDYEDRLQCFLPVWEAMLPGQDGRITSDLIFDLNMFLSLGKLRYRPREHLTDLTTQLLLLAVMCKYHTVELPREAAAHGRREARLATQGKNSKVKSSCTPRAKFKAFNWKTYKYHVLRDYASTCRLYGLTDNMSTQTGKCEHCRVKRGYERTNKHKHVGQIAQHTRRAEKLHIIDMHVTSWRAQIRAKRTAAKRVQHASEGSDSSGIVKHADPEPIFCHLPRTEADNTEKFAYCLILHSIAFSDDLRTPEIEQETRNYTFEDRSRLIIYRDQLYPHQMLRLNYTTYDLHRSQDVISPRTHGDIMLLSPSDTTFEAGNEPDDGSEHPYVYARVVKIFHINIRLADSAMMEFERMDILFVDRDIFMRYYGGVLDIAEMRLRLRMARRDDDLAQAQAKEEELFRQAAHHPNDLLELVPEIAEAGGKPDSEYEIEDETAGHSGSESSNWDDEDAAREDLIGIGDSSNSKYDQYDLEGYAPP
ncbi:hypothetical protein C8Q80DRAFT_1117215 [Daedaleopsis nitida]|nr:hypothetical protein C8Q80DRAFT_1117215 [Daedaleopsis nitida]